MKKYTYLAYGLLITSLFIILGVFGYYRYNLNAPSKSDEVISIEIPKGSIKEIASALKEKGLIRNEKVFILYTKLANKKNLKAGYYEFSKNTNVEKIVAKLIEGSTINPNEISITFKEGINMRDIARLIESKTNNSYDDVINKSNDINYINSLIDRYWFITEDVKNENIYYKLEGYLFPDTYRFKDKNVSVEEIFDKMIEQMNSVLKNYKNDILKANLSIHSILTLASIIEEESYDDVESKKNISSVFLNRIKLGWSLGSDVTTRYAVKEDNNKKALTVNDYQTKSLYNTRLTDGSMNGKLPIGPIATFSKDSLEAAIYPNNTNYLYFIANIQTKDTFFFNSDIEFSKKKQELKAVNGGF